MVVKKREAGGEGAVTVTFGDFDILRSAEKSRGAGVEGMVKTVRGVVLAQWCRWMSRGESEPTGSVRIVGAVNGHVINHGSERRGVWCSGCDEGSRGAYGGLSCLFLLNSVLLLVQELLSCKTKKDGGKAMRVNEAEGLSGLKDAWKERISISSPNGEGLRPLRGEEPAGPAAGGWKRRRKPNMIAERQPSTSNTAKVRYALSAMPHQVSESSIGKYTLETHAESVNDWTDTEASLKFDITPPPQLSAMSTICKCGKVVLPEGGIAQITGLVLFRRPEDSVTRRPRIGRVLEILADDLAGSLLGLLIHEYSVGDTGVTPYRFPLLKPKPRNIKWYQLKISEGCIAQKEHFRTQIILCLSPLPLQGKHKDHGHGRHLGGVLVAGALVVGGEKEVMQTTRKHSTAIPGRLFSAIYQPGKVYKSLRKSTRKYQEYTKYTKISQISQNYGILSYISGFTYVLASQLQVPFTIAQLMDVFTATKPIIQERKATGRFGVADRELIIHEVVENHRAINGLGNNIEPLPITSTSTLSIQNLPGTRAPATRGRGRGGKKRAAPPQPLLEEPAQKDSRQDPYEPDSSPLIQHISLTG
ncbi:hypothetical protein B0H19DRAFT_1072591 [Mycena capillaripes]|nr:hypothetical protein B0H19DRAFT_1072591 [Mycena capillaripes]